MNNLIPEEIFKAIKATCKTKKITYKALSEHLNMSESGIKKIMTNEDCTLNKISKICNFLELNLEDLAALSRHATKGIRFSKTQEAEMIKEPSVYHYLIELLKSEHDEEKVRKTYKISKATSLKYLRKLDKLNLIELHTDNKIKAVFKKPWNFGVSPELGRIVARGLDIHFIKYADEQFNMKNKKGHMGTRGNYQLTSKSISEMKEAFEQLINEFSKRSRREIKLYNKDDLMSVTSLNYLVEGFDSKNHIKLKNF